MCWRLQEVKLGANPIFFGAALGLRLQDLGFRVQGLNPKP